LLEKEGYSDVTISWRIPSDRKSIILRVSSGPRLVIDEVEVVGVPDEEAETMAQYFTGKALLGGETNTPYLPEKVAEATQSSVTYLKAQGYWAATGELAEPSINLEKRTVDLTVQTNPGPLHKIASLEIDGTIPPELPELPNTLQQYLTQTATAATLREIRDGTTSEMRDKGYQFASSSLEAQHEKGQSRLKLTLQPGQRYLFRGTTITGAEGIDLARVRKLFNRSSGKPYDEKEVTKLRNSILATGAFDAIDRDRTIDEEARAIDVTLHLKEGKPKGISYYLGAGTIEGFILGASYYDRNFLDKLYNFNVAAEYSAIGFLGEVSVTDPFLLGYDLRATPRAFALTRTFDEYFKFETGFGFTLSYQPTPRQIWEADARFSYATVQPEDLPASALGATDYLLTTIGATWLYDARDSKVSPTEGLFARVRAELGAVSAETPNAFFRLNGQVSYHLPLNEKSRLGFNLRTGILSPTDGDELPIDLRYFLGGPESVRSFPFRELGPSVNGTARGGQAFWSANAEYIRKLAGPLYGVAFFDAGSLDESALAWPSFEPKLAAGIGLRLDLPIGPIRFEYGRALNPDDGDPSGAFHFAIGAAF
jgi:outer membrane protein assembly factor BamA